MAVSNIVTSLNDTTSGRFDSGESTEIYNWINRAYAFIWSRYDWPWKRVTTTGSHVAGTATVTLPTDYGGRVLKCWNSATDGSEIKYIDPDTFLGSVLGTGSTNRGTPSMFTVYDTTWRFYPVPQTSQNFTYVYERRPAVKTSGGTITDRVFSSANSTDTPIWDPIWDYVLVSGAMATGLMVQNDPTWQQAQEYFMQDIMAMAEFYIPPARGENMQYGADNL